MHFLCLEPRETDKNVLKFSKNWVLKFNFLLLGALNVHLQGNPDLQRFTMQSGVLTGNNTRWRSASNGSPLPE